MQPIRLATSPLLLALAASGASLPARAALFTPGDLVVSTSTYEPSLNPAVARGERPD